MLNRSSWRVNHKHVERIWFQEGLKVPKEQSKRDRLLLNNGSCIRLPPTHCNHVWSYDFVMYRTHAGKSIKILTIIDEYSRHCLVLEVDRSIKSDDVLDRLSNLFLIYGIPEHICSDNGSEFAIKAVRESLSHPGNNEDIKINKYYSTILFRLVT